MIGIIGAMPEEIAAIKDKVELLKTETVGGMKFTTGKVFGHSVVLAMAGIGKVFAAACTQTMIIKYSPEFILNIGVAGSLVEELKVFDVVVATEVVQHDFDCTPMGLAPGYMESLGITEFPCDADLSDKLAQTASQLGSINIWRLKVATGDQFISKCDQKQRIVETFDAKACDMEAGAIAQICYVNKIPFAMLRSISDSGETGHNIEYESFMKNAAANSAEIILKFLNSKFLK